MSKASYVEQGMVFSKSTDGELYVAPNFQVKEFACSDGSDVVVIHPFIPHICQLVRNKFNMPFVPNSAYRTVTHNKAVGGANKSNHTYGRAVLPLNSCMIMLTHSSVNGANLVFIVGVFMLVCRTKRNALPTVVTEVNNG